MVTVGPSCAELEELLAGLSPRRELVARMALRGVFDQCRVDKRWKARIDELMASMSANALAEVHGEAHTMARRIKAEIL